MWHSWPFLTNRETQTMTLRVSKWQSESDLYSVHCTYSLKWLIMKRYAYIPTPFSYPFFFEGFKTWAFNCIAWGTWDGIWLCTLATLNHCLENCILHNTLTIWFPAPKLSPLINMTQVAKYRLQLMDGWGLFMHITTETWGALKIKNHVFFTTFF